MLFCIDGARTQLRVLARKNMTSQTAQRTFKNWHW